MFPQQNGPTIDVQFHLPSSESDKVVADTSSSFKNRLSSFSYVNIDKYHWINWNKIHKQLFSLRQELDLLKRLCFQVKKCFPEHGNTYGQRSPFTGIESG